MTMRKIFNPLNHIEVEPGQVSESTDTNSPLDVGQQLESTSAIYNETVGVCPKCGNEMTTSKIANDDVVFFCQKDRVALPRPDLA